MSKQQELAKRFQLLINKWPKQEFRTVQFTQYLQEKADSIKEPTAVICDQIETDLNILQQILDNKLQKQYALDANSPILAFLPPLKTYQLLDEYPQQVMAKENTWSFFGFRLSDAFKR